MHHNGTSDTLNMSISVAVHEICVYKSVMNHKDKMYILASHYTKSSATAEGP